MMDSQRFMILVSFVITILLSSISSSYSFLDHVEKQSSFSRAYRSYMKAINGFMFQDSATMADFAAVSAQSTFNVDDFGAKGDGKTDDTQAFMEAWKEACSSRTTAVFSVSKNKNYLVKQIRFQGPCKSSITMEIYGTILASKQRSDYSEDQRHWLRVDRVDNMLIEGGGVINGNGDIWWKKSCKINKSLPCKDAPTALTFYKNKNLVVNNVKIQNGQQIHVSFDHCVNVEASNIQVTAPEKSPNTDGIHVTHTRTIKISNSTIATGDDCISIVDGSKKVEATGITCGPGHGISIGSLGEGNSEAHVSDVTVNEAYLSGTTNGVRIKTWQGGSGSAKNIKFMNINLQNVKNPIIIDQNYCDQDDPCDEQESAVQIKNVIYQNIKGTSASKDAIIFNCSTNYPCKGIVLQEINITEEDGGDANAICSNVNLTEIGTVIPQCP